MTENGIEIIFPLDWKLSKNQAFYFTTENGRAVKHKDFAHSQLQKDIEMLVRAQKNLKGWKPEKKKTWLSIHVYKKNHTGDGINLLDGIADAVKKAVGIDDCWFSSLTDWTICDPKDQHILIKVSQ
jgi:hypothetical protein